MRTPRDPLLHAAAALLVGVAALGVAGSSSWVGKTFPGFLVLENRVVASAGLSHWPATRGGEIYQHEIVSVDGVPLEDAAALRARVEAEPPGTPLRYRFRRGEAEFERVIETRLFDRTDFALLFGSMLLSGLALGGVALLIRSLRGNDRLASGSFPSLYIVGLWAITAIDLYGPYRLFRLHALCETLLFAGSLHMALVFPHPSRVLERWPRLVWIPYGLAAGLALVNQVGLYDPGLYRTTHLIATSAFGASLAFFIGSQVRWYLRPPSFDARQRVKVVAFGAVAALSPQVFLTLGSALTGGETPQNVMAFSGVLFPFALGYAVLRSDVLEVDVLVRRSLSYALLTLVASLGYVGLIHGFEALSTSSARSAAGEHGFVFSIILLIALLPLRDRVQAGIDRLFFRTEYDFRRIVETASERLASVSDLDVIGRELAQAVGDTLHPERVTLYVRRGRHEAFEALAGPDALDYDRQRLARAESAIWPAGTRDRGLLVPFRTDGELVAVLVLGGMRSGGLYSGEDRRLLQTLANQGAVAIKNALALEQLRALNRDLEAKVDERTQELRETQAQLVHREKMASVGQFVAGIAHELNNPLNFIQGNLHCLREYADALTRVMQAYDEALAERAPKLAEELRQVRERDDVEGVLADMGSAFDGCSEGIERSTTLVRDLRVFSRLDQPEHMAVDLHEAIESTLNLLRSTLTGIEVVKDFGDLPLVECLAGQLNQVFMNLIANAADATGTGGRIEIRTRPLGGERVAVEIADDGEGIDAEHIDRIFDPFFTTKAVGKGTGLGLSISYGIITRHGGRIAVESQPGVGTRFRIELPRTSEASPAD